MTANEIVKSGMNQHHKKEDIVVRNNAHDKAKGDK
jgi:hypothetical protein